MSVNRRQFIRGLVALAATAVVVDKASGIATLLSDTERERFLKQARTGIIRNEWFEFRQPVVLEGFENLHITDCHFIFHDLKAGEYGLTLGKGCRYVTISSCAFDNRSGHRDSTMIYVESGKDSAFELGNSTCSYGS